MSNVLRMSDAASLALHGMVLMAARRNEVLSTKDIAKVLNASEAHLSKVLQRLSRAGLLESVRGRTGGFALRKSPAKTSLLEVYEAIEGRLAASTCLLGKPICRGKKCILGKLLQMVSKETRRHLSRTKLNELVDVFSEKKR